MTQDSLTRVFDSRSTAAEVLAGVDLTGKSAIVTGGASGIGTETARALAAAGADVTIAVRDTAAGERVAAEIEAGTGRPVRTERLDLTDLDSVAAFTAGWHGPLHMLVNNAGIMAVQERTLATNGWELHLATNHLGHFALARGLHGALRSAAGARVVSLTSRGHLRSPVEFDDPHFGSRAYDPYVAYGQSKTANVLFAVEADHRWRADGIVVNAVHPGAIAGTGLGRHIPEENMGAFRSAAIYQWKSVEQGAATSVLVATAPELAGVGGRYFEDCHEADVLPAGTDFTSTGAGVAHWAVDRDAAARLWQLSEDALIARG